MALFTSLPGRKFDLFGRRIGLKVLKRDRLLDHLLLNPVSSVRYFEYAFASAQIPEQQQLRLLDISSPFLFGFFLVETRDLDYLYVNPDVREFSRIEYLLPFLDRAANYHTEAADATSLDYDDGTFDSVVSLSVIEHISGTGDSKAISEMWRVLKAGGRLILTFPVNKHHADEYREENVYLLKNTEQKDDAYFFQRFYDEDTVQERLLNHLPNHKVEKIEIIGEKEQGFFNDYEKRWISRGLKETVKDPWYMARKMQRFDALGAMPGMGIMCISLTKSGDSHAL
jgi:SAM-dependent methyltransferase